MRAARRPVDVVRTGMGPRRSEQALPRLTAAPARALAVMGFCGALDGTLSPVSWWWQASCATPREA